MGDGKLNGKPAAKQAEARRGAELSEHAHKEIGYWLAATPPEGRNAQRFQAEVALTHGLAVRPGDRGWDIQAAQRAFWRVAEQGWWRKLGPEELGAPEAVKEFPLLQLARHWQGQGPGPRPAPRHSASQVMGAQQVGAIAEDDRLRTSAETDETAARLGAAALQGGWGDSGDAAGAGSRPLRVVIEAGHGGRDPGAVYGDLHEADFNLALAQALAAYSGRGIVYEVVMRPAEGGLGALGKELKKNRPDIVISLHHNAVEKGEASGALIIYDKEHIPSAQLAGAIQRIADPSAPGLAGTGKMPATKTWPYAYRGGANWRYPLHDSGRYASVQVEAAYGTNKDDLARMQTEEYRQQVARELDQAVREWARAGQLLTAEGTQPPATTDLGVLPGREKPQHGVRRVPGIYLPPLPLPSGWQWR